ncbi:MAG: bifunctional aspartate kinase/homoserine dehydrogenase I [Cyclobacteriaceae bacterium]|nr:bifunctional aspartate kinase/homoserine dehydrogenase I [Cyclobacteriaceae bacterium]MCX7637135.1 bifunctional aspartate kinase/homoserine dehydrogenase I [Cyclobacteriaceae bacterium]MDW8330037.1 bifunctional aspartate kinase/homoserine dehydrogenase I [Cyclobacteriaceae bacterium]
MKVLKFGGSSVATPGRISNVIEIVKRNYQPDQIALVFSAFGGVTDQLIRISDMAVQGDAEYTLEFRRLAERHQQAIRDLITVSRQSHVLAHITIQLNELEDILHGVYLIRERTPRSLDYIMSFGERLSAYIISEAFNSAGISAEYADARKLIQTDNQFGAAQVDFEVSFHHIREHFKLHKQMQVITGFIASSATGETTTLGRSGSDYTASIIAAALHAEVVEIWTDVDGIMTANPKLVKKAFTIPEMSYEEAMELSHFGAKVIFPATMRPAMEYGIPIRIKNTFNPVSSGTLIRSGKVNGKLIKGISVIDRISLVNVQGSGMVGVVGIAQRLFEALTRERINVILISQASSEHSICLAVEAGAGKRALRALEREFRHELRDKHIDHIYLGEDHSIIAVVGDGMKHQPGTSGRMFSALGKNGVNVVAIAQGSSERNISAVIRNTDTAKAVAALHDAFFLSDNKTVNVFLVGTGLIGSTLLRQLANQQEQLIATNHLEIRLIGLANSRKMFFNYDGINPKEALQKLHEAGDSMNLEMFRKTLLELNLPNSVFVDCTASEQVAGLYESLLQASVSVVTPNKKANSGAYENYKKLVKARLSHGVYYLYETNVSAGLPVISTLNDLLLSGDTVIRIEAVLSGTLNYIFSNFTEGKKFSEIVADAKAKGFTEPDVRDDLSGMDVARKILILARECGLTMEPEQVEVQSLIPERQLTQLTADAFMEQLADYDHWYENFRREAQQTNRKLCYTAVLQDGNIRVGLQFVSKEHPFYGLSGSDNILMFTTSRYRERPMVIRGPGAGAEVTAAGVFADIIRIGNHIR